MNTLKNIARNLFKVLKWLWTLISYIPTFFIRTLTVLIIVLIVFNYFSKFTTNIKTGTALLIQMDGILVEQAKSKSSFDLFIQSNDPKEIEINKIIKAINLAGDDKNIESIVIDLSNFIGTTENWETGLLSINPVNYENNQLYFLAGYTDKDIRVTISIFIYDFSKNRVEKFKDLFISPQNANLDWLNCGNIERVNSNTWVFCVGDQDTLYALNETSLTS